MFPIIKFSAFLPCFPVWLGTNWLLWFNTALFSCLFIFIKILQVIPLKDYNHDLLAHTLTELFHIANSSACFQDLAITNSALMNIFVFDLCISKALVYFCFFSVLGGIEHTYPCSGLTPDSALGDHFRPAQGTVWRTWDTVFDASNIPPFYLSSPYKCISLNQVS